MNYLATFGRFALALAPAHFLLCYTYIYFYSYGFGQNLHIFFGIEDIFSVGISRIFFYYLSSFVAILICYIIYIPRTFNFREIDGNEVKPWVILPLAQKSLVIISVFLVVSLALSILLFGIVFKLLIVLLSSILIGYFFGFVSSKNKFRLLVGMMSTFFVLSYLLVCLSAYSDGFQARTAPYLSLRSDFSICENGNVVLMSIGERFLVVDNLATRFLADEECKPIVQFPPVKVLIDMV